MTTHSDNSPLLQEASLPSAGAGSDSAPPPAAGPAESPRAVIRGESLDSVGIDWLSWSSQGLDIPGAAGIVSDWVETDVRVAPSKRGGLGFQYLAPLIAHGISHDYAIGIIAWGGESQRGITHVSLSATGTALISDWERVANDLVNTEGYLTRLDIAADDLQGDNSVDLAVSLYRGGGFSAGGRAPSCITTGDWLRLTGNGRTFYIGKREHGKMLRVYEKGRELGDKANPDWVRWEIQLNRKHRTLPPDMVLEPLRYWAGAYRCLREVDASGGKRLRIQERIGQLSEDRLMHACRVAYGKLIDYLLRATGGDYMEVVDLLRRPGIPSRLYLPAYGRECARRSLQR